MDKVIENKKERLGHTESRMLKYISLDFIGSTLSMYFVRNYQESFKEWIYKFKKYVIYKKKYILHYPEASTNETKVTIFLYWKLNMGSSHWGTSLALFCFKIRSF